MARFRLICQVLFTFICLFGYGFSEECLYDSPSAECNFSCEDVPCICRYANHFFVGPEIYHIRRTRESGSKQSGTIYAGRVGYDHIKRYKFYWGGDVLYGKGELHGKSALGRKLKSHFTDFDVEGRLGYTFEQKEGYQFSFTPFAGIGYAFEQNNFLRPSPLTIHSRIHYTYVPVGFLSKISWSPCLDIGLNFKAKYLFEGKNKISHDPNNDSASVLIKSEMQYRVELPITYKYWPQLFVNIVPFYEYRHFGRHAGLFFNFDETKINIYGAAFRLSYNW